MFYSMLDVMYKKTIETKIDVIFNRRQLALSYVTKIRYGAGHLDPVRNRARLAFGGTFS